ncbi:hypothetical protein PMAYCL1PPCAC_01358, partial [Pristionchus mayeri]
MKCKKGCRRMHASIVGPTVILKVLSKEDSFAPFATRHYEDTNWQWTETLLDYNTDGLFREDPFGVSDYLVPFSLNKKRRWTVLEKLEEIVKNAQDPYRNLRISVSVHACSRNNRMPQLLQRPFGWERQASHVEDCRVEQYLDVLRNGQFIHRTHRNAHLDTLDHNTLHAKRPRTDDEFHARFNLPFEENQLYQKAHIRYNILKLVRDKRPVHPHNLPSYHRPHYHRPRHSLRRARNAWHVEVKLLLNDVIDEEESIFDDSEEFYDDHCEDETARDCPAEVT